MRARLARSWLSSPFATRARVLSALALLSFGVLAVLVRGPVPGLDLAITRSLQDVRWLRAPMLLVSVPGNGFVPYALTAATAIAFVAVGLRRDAGFLALSTISSAILNGLVKHVVARPRPTAALVAKLDLVDGFSFPSGHVAFYVCYFGFLAAVAIRRAKDARVRRTLTTLAVAPVVLIPFSRVYLGAHWASDTLGALLWSTPWLAGMVAAYDLAHAGHARADS